MKQGTLEQWKELGDLAKKLHDDLCDLCVKADAIMPKTTWHQAGIAQGAISKFKCDAEDQMFRQLGEANGATLNIFYGRVARSYR